MASQSNISEIKSTNDVNVKMTVDFNTPPGVDKKQFNELASSWISEVKQQQFIKSFVSPSIIGRQASNNVMPS
jgi:hypothetical protein